MRLILSEDKYCAKGDKALQSIAGLASGWGSTNAQYRCSGMHKD